MSFSVGLKFKSQAGNLLSWPIWCGFSQLFREISGCTKNDNIDASFVTFSNRWSHIMQPFDDPTFWATGKRITKFTSNVIIIQSLGIWNFKLNVSVCDRVTYCDVTFTLSGEFDELIGIVEERLVTYLNVEDGGNRLLRNPRKCTEWPKSQLSGQ